MNTSQTTKEMTAALLAFSLKVDNIHKDAANPYFKSKYASLSNILEAIKIPLSECGLVLSQFPEGENSLTTRLMHSSGEWMEATYDMRPVKDDPQGRGSCITYQRRYAIAAILSLNIDEDDDGNKASHPPQSDDSRQWLNPGTKIFEQVKAKLQSGEVDFETVSKHYKVSKLAIEKLKL